MERNADFDNLLDDLYSPVQIGNLTFYASDILYNLDPIAYQISISEMEDLQE